jgi:hypothetical protein
LIAFSTTSPRVSLCSGNDKKFSKNIYHGKYEFFLQILFGNYFDYIAR